MTYTVNNIDHISSLSGSKPVVQAELVRRQVPQGTAVDALHSCTQSQSAVLQLDAPVLPASEITTDSTNNDDVIAVLCMLIRTNGEFSKTQSENFVKMKKLSQTMSTIVCEKANDSFETQTRLKRITDQYEEDKKNSEKVMQVLEIISWVVFGATAAMSLAAVAARFMTTAAVEAATTAASSGLGVGAAEASNAAAEAAASAVSKEVGANAMRAGATAVGDSVAAAGAEDAEAIAARSVSEGAKKAAVNAVDDGVIANQINNTGNNLLKRILKHFAGLVGAGLGSAPVLYNADTQLKMGKLLLELAEYQDKVGQCRAETDSCGQMVSYWGQSLERCTTSVNTIVEAERDTLDTSADYFQVNKQMAAMVSNSRRI